MNGPPLAAWGATGEFRPLHGGHRNTVLTTGSLVFKSTCRSEAALAWLTQVHGLARDAGFVVPALRPGLNGCLSQGGWTCEPFVDGTPVDPAVLPCLLPRVAAFHEAARNLPQRPGFASSKALLTQDSGGDVDLSQMPADLTKRCRDAWRMVTGRPVSIIHGDLSPANMILCPDGKIALIDWDECRRDLTLFDLASLRSGDTAEAKARLSWEIANAWTVEPAYARRLAVQL